MKLRPWTFTFRDEGADFERTFYNSTEASARKLAQEWARRMGFTFVS